MSFILAKLAGITAACDARGAQLFTGRSKHGTESLHWYVGTFIYLLYMRRRCWSEICHD
jgi:hypothetical protein